jgi:N-acetylglucosamine-6-sulfatase
MWIGWQERVPMSKMRLLPPRCAHPAGRRFEPAKRHLGKYENEKIEYPPSMADTVENYRGKPKWVREQRNSWHGVDYMYHGQMDYETFYKRYCETVLGIDDSIGRLMQTLEELGIADSTLVIYKGDNGFCFGEHGLIDKRHMYEESILCAWIAAFAPLTANHNSVSIQSTECRFGSKWYYRLSECRI